MVNIGNTTLAIQKGGDLATLATLYTIMPFCRGAVQRCAEEDRHHARHAARRAGEALQGLRIATTAAGSGTDQFIRTCSSPAA
jgi:hypothetical protein